MRDTKTKGIQYFSVLLYLKANFSCSQSILTVCTGIWVWGNPIEMDVDGQKTSVFYLDTEGFESIGKSNVYDDR